VEISDDGMEMSKHVGMWIMYTDSVVIYTVVIYTVVIYTVVILFVHWLVAINITTAARYIYYNITDAFKTLDYEAVEWINLAQDSAQGLYLVNTLMKLRVPYGIS
jgi:hypothetical protein